MINKSNTSVNTGLRSTGVEEYQNTYNDARKQIQVLNNTPISNTPPQFDMNSAEARRIRQITVSDTMLDQFKKNEIRSTQMNNVLFAEDHVPQPEKPVEVIENNHGYIAEIGDKRRLSNIIYNSLLKSFQGKTYTY